MVTTYVLSGLGQRGNGAQSTIGQKVGNGAQPSLLPHILEQSGHGAIAVVVRLRRPRCSVDVRAVRIHERKSDGNLLMQESMTSSGIPKTASRNLQSSSTLSKAFGVRMVYLSCRASCAMLRGVENCRSPLRCARALRRQR